VPDPALTHDGNSDDAEEDVPVKRKKKSMKSMVHTHDSNNDDVEEEDVPAKKKKSDGSTG